MNELISLLTRVAAELTNQDSDPDLVAMCEQAILLAGQQATDNQRLKRVLEDIRERDLRKNCLCRGIK